MINDKVLSIWIVYVLSSTWDPNTFWFYFNLNHAKTEKKFHWNDNTAINNKQIIIWIYFFEIFNSKSLVQHDKILLKRIFCVGISMELNRLVGKSNMVFFFFRLCHRKEPMECAAVNRACKPWCLFDICYRNDIIFVIAKQFEFFFSLHYKIAHEYEKKKYINPM